MTQKSTARLNRDLQEDKTTTTTPRQTAEIDAEYGHTCALAGDIHIKIKMLEMQLNQHQQKLWSLNQEAAKRRELDSKNHVSEATTPLQTQASTPETVSTETH